LPRDSSGFFASGFHDHVLRNHSAATDESLPLPARDYKPHPHQNVLRPGLGVFDEHIEVAVVVEMPVSSNSNSG